MAEMTVTEESTVSPDGGVQKEDSSYKAPYIEIAKDDFAKDPNSVLRGIVPTEFNLADEEGPGDLTFRFFDLPEGEEERKKRVAEIQVKGTDRTNPKTRSSREKLYEMAAQKGNVPPLDIFDTMTGWDLQGFAKQGFAATTHLSANGLLIYDKKTEKGIKKITGPESTFKDPNRRNEALLGIIGFK